MPEEQQPGLLLTIRVNIRPSLSDGDIAKLASLLEAEAISTSWERTASGWEILWLVDFYPQRKPLLRKIEAAGGIALKDGDLDIQPVADTDWLAQSYRQFPPFRVKKFFIHGSHFQGRSPQSLLPLTIDAATAFGSGEHGTTRGCLEAMCLLDANGFRPRRSLDMGTGSGILGIAAWLLWQRPVLAVDNDREAVRVACRHRKMNAVPAGDKGMICVTGNGYRAPRVQSGGPFDLIIANILAQPLIDMAPEVEKRLSRRGRVVLSGLLTTQAAAVLKAHQALGLKKTKALRHDEWTTLMLERGR